MSLRKTADNIAGISRTLLQARRAKPRFPLPIRLTGSYLVSSELGIAHLRGDEGRFLTCWTGYGMAIRGQDICVVDESTNGISRVLSLNLDDVLSGRHFLPFKARKLQPLFQQPYRSTNGRIHQLTAAGQRLLIAASEWNAIVELDLATPQATPRTIHPFKDQFGAPIKGYDHNHINSAITVGDDIFFVAYKTGDSSLIGHIRDKMLLGWHVLPRGYHDLYPTPTGFVTCDTFGNSEAGRVMTETGSMASSFFIEKKLAPRGVARTGEEWLIGHSHKGPRAKRFKGKGAIVAIQGAKEPVYCELPCAQVYQILRIDGQLLTDDPRGTASALSQAFGPPLELGQVFIS